MGLHQAELFEVRRWVQNTMQASNDCRLEKQAASESSSLMRQLSKTNTVHNKLCVFQNWLSYETDILKHITCNIFTAAKTAENGPLKLHVYLLCFVFIVFAFCNIFIQSLGTNYTQYAHRNILLPIRIF